jgi:sporulation protein YlmC with PRC-barrel domain
MISNSKKSKDQNRGSAEQQKKLMVSGNVSPEGNHAHAVEVRRGMQIFSQEDLEVGKVAAVVLNSDNRKATYILLSCLPERTGYWLIPVDLIAAVGDEGVRLTIPHQAIQSLPRWHSD